MVEIPELNITCGTTDCENGHHAFNNPKHVYENRGHGRNFLDTGVCKGCGINPVDWSRLHSRNLLDVGHTFEMLRLETIRWHFWTQPFNQRSLDDARLRGRQALSADVPVVLKRIVGPPAKGPWSFQQVPTKAAKMRTVIQYAQHAVAACCRKCVEEWHGVPNDDQPMCSDSLGYLEFLALRYLDERLPPDVKEGPQLPVISDDNRY